MLTDLETAIALKLRFYEGPHVNGIGPDIYTLCALFDDIEPGKVMVALEKLDIMGFIILEKRLGGPRKGVPQELNDVLGISILESLQAYFDDSKNQKHHG